MLVALISVALGGPAGPPIVGGTESAEGAWPDVGGLYMGDLFACTSVLIAPDVLLTAAHCFGSPYAAKRVVLDTTDLAGSDGVVVDVLEGWVYPEPFDTYDIAVFVLAEPAPVAHRPLLLDCLVDDYLVEGAKVTIAGFGATDDFARQTTTLLHEATTTVTDPACDRREAGCNLDVAPTGELVAGGDGVDSCVGDSGGPLYLHTPSGVYLAGITSRAALPASTPCGSGGIYVRADAVADWVEEVTGRTLDRPVCDGVNRPPRPTAGELVVPHGGVGHTVVEPGDPNPDDTHTFEIVDDGVVNEVEIDGDGVLTYRSWRISAIAPDVTVRVTDQSGASADLVIPVVLEIPPPPLETGCACRSAAEGGSWLAWSAVLLGLARRRRRPGLHRRGVEARPGRAWSLPSVRRARGGQGSEPHGP